MAVLLLLGGAPAGRAAEEGLRLIGTIPFGVTEESPRMLVDPGLNLGFTIGEAKSGGSKLLVYDLEKLRIVSTLDTPGLNQAVVRRASVDQVNHRLLFPPPSIESNPGCLIGPSPALDARIFDIRNREWSSLPMPCTNGDQFASFGISYDPGSAKFYALGTPVTDFLHYTVADDTVQRVLLRQINAGTGALDWEVNLTVAGCDGMTRAVDEVAFVRRFGSDVLAFCWDRSPVTFGSLGTVQGYAVRVPLENDRPIAGTAGLPVVHLTPTLPDAPFLLFDPGSGRMMLLTVGNVNGNGVWVYDPLNERFAGVIASGIPSSIANVNESLYFGVDEIRGRVYFQSAAGLLLADVRNDPLPSGITVGERIDQGPPHGELIAVAPRLHRIFIPVEERLEYLVYEDAIPQPPPPPDVDPDGGTADVPEQEGKTDRVFSGVGGTYGVHLLNTGGINRLINNRDEICPFLAVAREIQDPAPPQQVRDAIPDCLADILFTAGDRELFLASTQTDVGSASGAFANASAANFSTTDSATDTDFRRVAECFSEDIAKQTGSASEPAREGYANACDSVQIQLKNQSIDFSGGTRGPDGRGFPVRGSECQDPGTGETKDQQVGGLEGFPTGMVGSSSVLCNASKTITTARAVASGFAIPDVDAPLLSIARTWSSVTTEMTAEGLQTTETSDAAGVVIGDFSIGHVSTSVTTVAKGRTGSTKVSFSRTISNVRGPGISCPAACDPAEVVEAFNAAFGLRVRARLPEANAFASDRGYQAVAVKDRLQHDSDRTMNDDDTFEIAGLEIVFYNDGQAGRSRVVLHLAGVRGESRYGIFLLPEGLGGDVSPPIDIPGSGPVDLGGTNLPGPSAPPGSTIIRIVRAPAELVAEGLRLIVTNPREFGLLFAMWSLFAIPVYLRFRRHSLYRTLKG